MYDIRQLTLFKQHYRDSYDDSLSCQYSCWGYFDGLDIAPDDSPPDIQRDVPFSTLWHTNGKKVSEQIGNFSAQNIGLLRYQPDETAKDEVTCFWAENECMPYFAVMLVQLKDESKYAEAASLVERIGTSSSTDSGADITFRTMAYCTFDNTDLVLLIHSNNLNKLHQTLGNIEALPEICYAHSIVGVAEEYLKECQTLGAIPETFRNTNCWVHEYIPELQFNVVTNGDVDAVGILRTQLKQWARECGGGLRHATVADKSGHETFVICLRNVSVEDMLRLFIPGAFGTHQNPIYGTSVYNISTSLLFSRRSLSEVPERPEPKPPGQELPQTYFWCKQLMAHYRAKLGDAQNCGDESLCSYYQAMFQTLNTMSQYEQFTLSKGIFLALIPSLRMFSAQFFKMLANSNEPWAQENLKESLCQYLEYVNMVIYHTTHTDQIFLMVPGYSGTSFSIPIKLMLLFLWLSRKLTYVLNDSDHTYEFILTPVMESKPMTHLIEFDTADQDRLIAIKVSQRLLYHPRELTIILSHEIAHYVGTALRCRHTRLEQLTKLLAYYVAERLLPSEIWQAPSLQYEQQEACREWYFILRRSLQRHLEQNVEAFQDEEPYAEACAQQVARECRIWLVAQTERVESLVLRIPEELEQKMLEDHKAYVRQMKFLAQIQDQICENWKDLLRSNDCDEVTEEVFTISREIFSDLVALAVLQCEKEEYREAFSASEGVPIDESNCPVTQWARQDMVDRVVFSISDQDAMYNMAEQSAREKLYQYPGVQMYLKNYADECWEQIQQRFAIGDVQRVQKEIQTFYQLISKECGNHLVNIYAETVARIREYGEEVTMLLNAAAKENTGVSGDNL